MARELAERVPDHLDASLLVPWTLERAGRIERAAAELRRVCSLFPEAFQPGLRLAELLVRDGKLDLAWAALEDAHACNPDTLSITLARIDVLFAKSQPVGVAALLEPLYAEYPSHREVKKRVARLEVESGRYVPARRLWREVTRFDRRVSGPPLHFERLDELPILPAGGEIRLFTRIRNERVRLPWLLDFYRSPRGRSLLRRRQRLRRRVARLPAGPPRHARLPDDQFLRPVRRWDALAEPPAHLHGSGGWCVTVDVDEVLAYPHARPWA